METLKTSAQFDRVRREGRTWGSGLLVLNAARNGQEKVRCGFITGKKVGKAVQRNRARRLMREAVRKRLPEVMPGWDLVWIGRASIADATYEAVCRDVNSLLQRSRVVTPGESQSPHRIETSGAQSRIIEEAGTYQRITVPKGGADE